MNLIAWLEFELVYCNVAVEHISHYTTGTDVIWKWRPLLYLGGYSGYFNYHHANQDKYIQQKKKKKKRINTLVQFKFCLSKTFIHFQSINFYKEKNKKKKTFLSRIVHLWNFYYFYRNVQNMNMNKSDKTHTHSRRKVIQVSISASRILRVIPVSVDDNICSPPMGELSSLVRELTVGTCIIQSSSNELSSR